MLVVDHGGDAQRLAAGLTVDQGLLPGDDAVEKRVDLVAETVLLLDLDRSRCAIAASPSVIGSPRSR